MISPFGHTNGRHDLDQNREPATPGYESKRPDPIRRRNGETNLEQGSHSDSDVSPLILVQSPEERVTKYLESLPETKNNAMCRNTVYEKKYGLLANVLVASCQALVVGMFASVPVRVFKDIVN